MNQNEFFTKYRPTAEIVSKGTGVDVNTVLAWMSWETDWATNLGSKSNNMSGIMYTANADFQIKGTSYAGYNSLANFAKDYIRVLNVNGYGYPAVIKIAKATEHEDVIQVTKALNASSYSVDDYNAETIAARAKAASGVAGTTVSTGGSSTQEKPVQCCSCGGGGGSFPDIPHSIRLEICKKVIAGVPMFEPTPIKLEYYNLLKKLLFS